jgi:hypothetical protein
MKKVEFEKLVKMTEEATPMTNIKKDITNALIRLGADMAENYSNHTEFASTEHIHIETTNHCRLWAESIIVTASSVTGWVKCNNSLGDGLHKVYSVPLEEIYYLSGQAEGSSIIINDIATQ